MQGQTTAGRCGSQQTKPVLWLEKDALFTPVSRIASRYYRVRTYAARGYSSFTSVYEAAQEIDGDKPVQVLVLSDFDPSGQDIVRDVGERLRRYGARRFGLGKIALTGEQVLALGLPPMPAKRRNPRYQGFVAAQGDQAVELDALPPDELERVVSRAIEFHIDWGQWDRDIERTRQEREEVRRRVEELLR